MQIRTLTAQDVIPDWLEKPQEGAEKMISKYGQPDEVSENVLIWHDRGPWHKIEVVNEEVLHNFPMPHHDFLRQVIHYKVPEDKICALARFDGSILIDRTKGELAARCHMEAMNILALNLAVDIIEENLTVSEARQRFAQIAQSFMSGKNEPYAEELQFRVPANTADPDMSLM